MKLGSTQLLTEMIIGELPCGVKAAAAYSRQLCHLCVLTVSKSWEPQAPGALGAYVGMYRDILLHYLVTQKC